MPEPTLLRLEEITHVGFVDVGANQEDGEGSFIAIWKRHDPSRRDKKMSKDFDRTTLEGDALKAFEALEEAQKTAETAKAEAETATQAALEAQKAAEAELAKATEEPGKEEDDLLKGLPADVTKVLEAQRAKDAEVIAKAQQEAEEAKKAAEEATKIAKAECEKRERKEFEDIVKADLSGLNGEGLADELYDTSKVMTAEAFESHMTRLKAASTQANTATLFKEAGSSKSTKGDAWAEIEALAKVLVEKGTAPTQAQAIDKVMTENTELYDQYQAERQS